MLIMFLFLLYELMQFKIERQNYLKEIWNYFELAGIIIFFWGAVVDIRSTHITETLRIIWTFSLMMTLIKILIIIQVFPQLNFLVIMFYTVIKEIVNFMILFLIFCMIFAECYHIVNVDTSSYGRTPDLLSHFISTLRGSMGDFAMLDIF